MNKARIIRNGVCRGEQEREIVRSSNQHGLTEQRAMGKYINYCLYYVNSVDMNLSSSFYPTNPLL